MREASLSNCVCLPSVKGPTLKGKNSPSHQPRSLGAFCFSFIEASFSEGAWCAEKQAEKYMYNRCLPCHKWRKSSMCIVPLT